MLIVDKTINHQNYTQIHKYLYETLWNMFYYVF